MSDLSDRIVHAPSGDFELDLSGLDLTEIPSEVCDFTHINQIDLSGNRLTSIPSDIGNLGNLRRLYLTENAITSLPDELHELKQLTTLDLSINSLQSVPEAVTKLPRLVWLDLSWNELSEVSNAIGDLVSVTTLNLAGNQLTDLPARIGELLRLSVLILRKNRLHAVPRSIADLRGLAELDLAANRLSSLPNFIGELSKLVTLDVSHNSLAAVPESLGYLKGLRKLELGGNPLAPEIKAAMASGFKTLKYFLELLADEGSSLQEAKLLVVGEGEVGKSTLLAALRDEPFQQQRESTHGIKVRPLVLSPPSDDASLTITLNSWDFGGQEIYRPTHQFFFTAPAIYIVVWKPRQGSEQGFIDYWVGLIRRRCGANVRIHIVATHADRLGRFAHFDEVALLERHGNLIEGIHHVDSETGLGIADLKTAVLNTAAKLPHLNRRLPRSWLNFQRALHYSGEPYLNFNEYLARAAEHGIDTASAESLARVATELGYWCYYPDTNGLDELVVLKADWLSTAISLVLDDAEINARNGLTEHRRLRQIWDDPHRPRSLRYSPSVHRVLLRLMEKYEVSYRISLHDAHQRPTSLVAQLVQKSAPDLTAWTEYGPKLKEQSRVCEFIDQNGARIIPEDLFYRLLVRMHRYSLGREVHSESVHWRSGLVIDRNEYGRALISLNRDQVKVTVKGAYPQFFLDQITEDMADYTRDFWPGLRFRNLLPCAGSCTDPERSRAGQFEISRLFARSAKGKPGTECGHCGEDVPIDFLINGMKHVAGDEDRLARSIDAALTPRFLELTAMLQQHTATVTDLSTPMKDILSRVEERLQEILRALADEAAAGPRLFTVTMADQQAWYSRATHQPIEIRLWCEHSRLPLHVLEGNNSRGVYRINIPKDWLVRSAPWIRASAALLRAALPLAMGSLKLAVDDDTWSSLEESLQLGQESLKTIADTGAVVARNLAESAGKFPFVGLGSPSPAQLRQLHEFLVDTDPTFAGMARVIDRGRYLWVHPTFESEYDPGLPEL